MSYLIQYQTILVTLKILISGSSALDTNSRLGQGQPVEYVLYDKYAKEWTYFPILREKWTFDGKLKFIIHGFNTHLHSTRFGVLERQLMTMMGELYSRRDTSLNVVCVDWAPLATGRPTEYEFVARNVGKAANMIAEILINWSRAGVFINWNMVHLIGFSLGAHVAGIVGDLVWKRTGGVVGRITGLDPAGPQFDTLTGELPVNTDGILDKSDAQFVDIYHCNMGRPQEAMLNIVHGRFGSAMKAGHVDFYPQGGTRQSYACTEQADIRGCSHKQCAIIYSNGVRHSFGTPACPCESYDIFLSSKCGCMDSNFTTAVYMGDRANFIASFSKLRYFAHVSGFKTLEADSGNDGINSVDSPHLNSDLFEEQPGEGQKNPNAVKREEEKVVEAE